MKVDERLFKKVKRELKKQSVKVVSEANKISRRTVDHINNATDFIEYKFNGQHGHKKHADWLIDRGYEDMALRPSHSSWVDRLINKLRRGR